MALLGLWVLGHSIYHRKQKLQVYDDALVLPRGFLRTKLVHIPFGDIQSLSESHEAGHSRLRLTVKDGCKFLIFAASAPKP